MSLQIKPFLAIGPTIIQTVGGAAGATTVTLGNSTTGLPLESVRIANVGTVAAFIQIINSSNTTTVGVTNAVPIISNQVGLFATGGLPCVALNAASTFTVTCYITGGIGGSAS
jgi:hypothetical protein